MSYFRPNIDRMSGYEAGEQPQELGYIKLNTNENPYPPSPRALKVLISHVGPELRLYPDPVAGPLRRAAACLHDVCEECVIAGNGSDDLLAAIIRAFVDPGQKIAYPVPTYSLYRTLAEIQDAKAVEIPFPGDYSLPEEELLSSGAKVIFLANPNSPTGTFIEREKAARLAEAFDGIVVVDEAYVDFAEDNCMCLAVDMPNVIVLRTFSKSYSMCGLRVGYGVAHTDLIEGLMKVKDSYNVNRLAVFAAAAAIEDIDYMLENVAKIKRTRGRFVEIIERMGFRCLPSHTNFVLASAPEGRSAKDIYEALKHVKILVRYFNTQALRDYIRITIGTDEEMDKLAEALARILS